MVGSDLPEQRLLVLMDILGLNPAERSELVAFLRMKSAGLSPALQQQVQISFRLDFVVHFCTCSQTVFCDRQFLSVANYCTLLHRENGSFEVLCLLSPSVTIDRCQL